MAGIIGLRAYGELTADDIDGAIAAIKSKQEVDNHNGEAQAKFKCQSCCL